MSKIIGLDGKPLAKPQTFEGVCADLRKIAPDIEFNGVEEKATGKRGVMVSAKSVMVTVIPEEAVNLFSLAFAATIAQGAFAAGQYIALGGKPDAGEGGDNALVQ